jgi:hypothetical protein
MAPTMRPKRLAPKAAQKKAPEADPVYIGLRLRGLARLVFCASADGHNADPIDHEAAFFISTELEEMAARLGA